MDRLSRCTRDFCPRMSQLTASTCHGPFVTDLPARISSPTLEFSLLKENLAGSQSIFKDILHASQGQLSDVPGPMNHFGSSATFTKNCLHFPTGRSLDPWHLGKLPGSSFIYPGNRRRQVKPAVDTICRRVTTDIRHLIRAWGIRWPVRFQSPRALVGSSWESGRHGKLAGRTPVTAAWNRPSRFAIRRNSKEFARL